MNRLFLFASIENGYFNYAKMIYFIVYSLHLPKKRVNIDEICNKKVNKMSTKKNKKLKSQFRKRIWLIFFAQKFIPIDYFFLKHIIIMLYRQ